MIENLITKINNNNKIELFINITSNLYTITNMSILRVLEEEGYIKLKSKKNEINKKLEGIIIKPNNNIKLELISKNSRKLYRNISQYPFTLNLSSYINLDTYIIRTSKGIMSNRKAYNKGIGGEIILKVINK